MLPTVFGFSFSELVVVVIVAFVVMGPKDLPKALRRLGQLAGKLRRAAADLRAQSGIDDALRSEGLADDINEIRKLARGELDAVQRVARLDDEPLRARPPELDSYARGDDFDIVRDREYPRDCCDSYNAMPDNALVYGADVEPSGPLARDPLYLLGDANAELPRSVVPEGGTPLPSPPADPLPELPAPAPTQVEGPPDAPAPTTGH